MFVFFFFTLSRLLRCNALSQIWARTFILPGGLNPHRAVGRPRSRVQQKQKHRLLHLYDNGGWLQSPGRCNDFRRHHGIWILTQNLLSLSIMNGLKGRDFRGEHNLLTLFPSPPGCSASPCIDSKQ